MAPLRLEPAGNALTDVEGPASGIDAASSWWAATGVPEHFHTPLS